MGLAFLGIVLVLSLVLFLVGLKLDVEATPLRASTATNAGSAQTAVLTFPRERSLPVDARPRTAD
jgi:hypothetical protein